MRHNRILNDLTPRNHFLTGWYFVRRHNYKFKKMGCFEMVRAQCPGRTRQKKKPTKPTALRFLLHFADFVFCVDDILVRVQHRRNCCIGHRFRNVLVDPFQVFFHFVFRIDI